MPPASQFKYSTLLECQIDAVSALYGNGSRLVLNQEGLHNVHWRTGDSPLGIGARVASK